MSNLCSTNPPQFIEHIKLDSGCTKKCEQIPTLIGTNLITQSGRQTRTFVKTPNKTVVNVDANRPTFCRRMCESYQHSIYV